MHRNTTVGQSPLMPAHRLVALGHQFFLFCLIFTCATMMLSGPVAGAQSTSGGGIQGTITDPSGAAVPNASVTATNTDTGVQTVRKTNGVGFFSLQPLQVGNYNVEIVAKGFQRVLQENVTVDNASVVGLNLKLTVGGESTTITVTDAPPFLNTTDASLGGTIENELYSSLPLSMNGGPRDPTAFQYLMPGVQENPANNTGTGANNGNSGIYGGTGQTNLNENYIEGVPVSNIAQQGSNNPISAAVSVDAVDQFSTITSGASTSFSGAGSTNYTIKSGGNQFHGTVFDFIRNTMFDSWGYFSKVPLSSGVAQKPGEHQNSYGGSLGGPILKDKLFFFGSYEGYHYTKITNTPQYITIPTLAQRTGDFTDVLGTSTPGIVDPTTGGFGSRTPYQGLQNGIPTYNVIPTSELSSISLYLQSALPKPTNQASFSNYLASLPLENRDYSVDVRIDYTLNSRNKFSVVGLGGNTGYGNQPFYQTQSQLPRPYADGRFINQRTASGILSYTYIASQTLINSLKYGFTRTWGQGFPLTGPNAKVNGKVYSASAAGITNLPPGNGSDIMPAVTFSGDNGPTAPSNWASRASTGPQATNSYSLIDNLQWVKGRHNITFGAQAQWLETNAAGFGGYSDRLSLTYHAYDTEFSTSNTGFNGDVYASFLAGVVYSSSISAQTITDVGARYHPMAPYIQDNWQVSSKLSLNLGFRYEYLQPYHEVKNRIAFLNTKVVNPIVGLPGVLEYAGFPNSSTPAAYQPYICHCRTPVHPYNKNFEPRIGFAYAATPTTVISGAYSLTLTHSGGVGGGAGATAGTGNNGEYQATSSYSQNGSTGLPAYYLNPGLITAPAQTVTNQGTQNGGNVPCVASGSCSVYSAIPPWTVPGITVNPLQSTGNYDYAAFFTDHNNDYNCINSGTACSPQLINYADPYYGGRGPQYITYNLSLQKMINKKAVLTIAYSGSQTHFLPGGSGRGYALNTYSPDYVQQYKNALPAAWNANSGVPQPYPGFTGTNATLSAALRPFPQFGVCSTGNMARANGCSNDLWGNTGNASYNALQINVTQRPWHNLSGIMNYTRAKQIDDTGFHRTQFPVGPQDGNFTRNYTANQIDRGLGQFNQTNAFNLTWSYTFPIGRGQAFFSTNRLAGLVGGGWQLSGIYRYRDGYPLEITDNHGCNTNANGGQGTCFPDYTPGFNKNRVRVNGRWGRGPGANAANITSISYINPLAFQCPDSSPTNNTYTCGSGNEPNNTWKLGNLARSAPYDLHGPGWWDIQLGIRRTFNVRETATLHLTFQVEADVDNATNSTFFNLVTSGGGVPWGAGNFGQISGQNASIQPRDWQFAGRFRF